MRGNRGQPNILPLHTEPAGILGTTDTVVERLDDAVFDARGVGTSRLRARALNLVGTEPIKTACGAFKVTASLTEDQPVTQITFRREHKFGGSFDADLRLRVRIEFANLQSSSAIPTPPRPTPWSNCVTWSGGGCCSRSRRSSSRSR